MIVKCTVCGKEFEAQKTTKKYCSNDCMNAARRKRRADKIANKGTSQGLQEKICLICRKSFTPKTPSANNRQCCYDCMPEGIQLTRGMFLAKLKESRGGKCVRCGYNKCLKALEFHHLDSSQKDFTISNDHFKLSEAVEESKKCILLCSNCHKELHDNLWSVQELKLEEKEEVEPYGVDK